MGKVTRDLMEDRVEEKTIDLMEDRVGNYRSKPLETLYSKDASLAFSRIQGLPVRAL